MKKERIDSFSGLKFLAVSLIFLWHSSLPKPPVDLGARCCEFLFLCSGFLVAYNYADRNIDCTWKESFLLVLKKVALFWPLHFIATTFNLFLDGFTINNILKYILKLLFLQSWSNNQDIYFTMNGQSWFLASLLFCYFLTPVFLKFLRSNYKAVIIFAITVAIRFIIEIVHLYTDLDYVNISLHVSPIVRALEFFIGMLLYPFFMYLKKYLKKDKEFLIFSIIEIIIIGLACVLLVRYNETWLRAFYVCMFGVVVMIFAFNKGIFSKFLSLKFFKVLSSVQFEFYILHATGLLLWNGLMGYLSTHYNFRLNIYISMLIAYLIILGVSFLYKKFFGERFSELLKKMLNKLFAFFEIDISL